MKKLIAIFIASLLPLTSFARGMMYYGSGYGYNNYNSSGSIWLILLLMLVPIIWICFIVAIFVFWIMMLIDAIKNAPEKTKIIWVIVIIFTHILGALIYYFMEKRSKNKIENKIEQKKEEI